MRTPRYGAMAMLFHWLLAAMILLALGLGLYMADLPVSPARVRLITWHKWLGVTILAVAALRLTWRLLNPPPALPATMAVRDKALAHLVHGAMYVLFFAVPLVGWARSSAAGRPLVYFGMLPLPDLVGKDKALAETLTSAHALTAYALGVLVALHVAAVAKHTFVDRDGILSRMLPGWASRRKPEQRVSRSAP